MPRSLWGAKRRSEIRLVGYRDVVVEQMLVILRADFEVAPLSWTPDLLSFRSSQWQGSNPLMRRSFAGR
jgi:hypothetical protein